MIALALLVPALSLCVAAAADGPAEKQHVLTITSRDMDGAVLTAIAWDDGAIVLQGAIAQADGTLSGRYYIVPARGTALKQLAEATKASADYWDRKSRRVSPTGLGHIESSTDAKMPLYGVGSLQKRINDAADMGGTAQRQILRLGRLVLHEREYGPPPFDGEVWSWSPAEINRIAYVDGKGDLWVARADGLDPQRLIKGRFTLPAWSDDGRAIAVAERKGDGRKWEVSIVLLPEALRSPDRE